MPGWRAIKREIKNSVFVQWFAFAGTTIITGVLVSVLGADIQDEGRIKWGTIPDSHAFWGLVGISAVSYIVIQVFHDPPSRSLRYLEEPSRESILVLHEIADAHRRELGIDITQSYLEEIVLLIAKAEVESYKRGEHRRFKKLNKIKVMLVSEI